MWTYRRRRTARVIVSDASNDVVSAFLTFPNSASSSEKLIVHPDDDGDGKNKGFAHSSNESQITDDDDHGKGFGDSLNESKPKMPVGPVGYDNTKLHQQAVQYPRACKIKSIQEIYAKTNPIYNHFQPSQMPERRTEPKEMTNVVDSDYEEGMTPRHRRKNHINSYRHSMRKRKSKTLVDTSDSEVTTPRLRVRGQLQGPVVDSSNSIAEEGITAEYRSKNHFNACQCPTRRRSERIIDTSDSEVTMPLYRVRGQPRRPMDFSTSITLDTKLFSLYMEHIWSGVSEEKRNSVACMDCFWFCSYTESLWKKRVLEWIKRRNIFSKKYVLVPIVMWSHWNVLIFCHFGESLQSKSITPCMLLLDSLRMTNPKRLEPIIRKFVMDIYKKEERPETKALIRKIPLLIPTVPQQIDDKRCGYFVLYYIHLFIENAPEKFSINEGYPYFMKEDWFTLEEFDSFCKTLDSVSVHTSSSDE